MPSRGFGGSSVQAGRRWHGDLEDRPFHDRASYRREAMQSMRSIQDRLADYMVCFLILETLMIGAFCALDLVLFDVFFEGGL